MGAMGVKRVMGVRLTSGQVANRLGFVVVQGYGETTVIPMDFAASRCRMSAVIKTSAPQAMAAPI